MRDLMPGPELAGSGGATRGGANGASGKGDGDFDSAGLEEYAPMLPFFGALWSRVDAAVDYPDDFVRQRIAGSVSVKLTVDERGAMRGDEMEIRSDNGYLEAYVCAILLHTLREPLERRFRVKRRATTLNLVFDFETTGDYGVQGRDPGDHVRNSFLFKRRSYVEPIVNETIERVLTRYIPPIIPIPGGFIIDFVHLYRFIESFNRPDEREQRRVRISLLKRNLDQVIRREARKPGERQ